MTLAATGSVRSIRVFAMLLLLTAALPPASASGQATAPQKDPDRDPPPDAAPTTVLEMDDLRRRTGNFEPGRFNLSVEGGLGLIHAVSPYALAPGEVAVAASVLNFDRNPGDVDFFEYGFQAAVGLPGRVELFIRTSPVLRTNSVNQDPFGFPMPPLDLFVDVYPEVALRPEPYMLFAQEAPYKSYYVHGVTIDPPGHGAFAQSSGTIGAGGKVNLLSEDRGDRLGLGVRAHVEFHTERPDYHTLEWRRYTGVSGEMNVGAAVLVAKRVGRVELFGNVGFERIGDPDRGIRVQFVDSSKWGTPAFAVGAPVASPLDLHDQLSMVAATWLPAFNVRGLQFWLLGEFSYLRYVGSGSSVERLVHPGEVRLGIQANIPKFPALALGVAWQLLINDAGDGGTRLSNLRTPDGRGDINFSDGVEPWLSDLLRREFAGQGLTFSENSTKVFSTNNPAFDELRNVPTGPTPVVGLGGGNILAFITWRIN